MQRWRIGRLRVAHPPVCALASLTKSPTFKTELCAVTKTRLLLRACKAMCLTCAFTQAQALERSQTSCPLANCSVAFGATAWLRKTYRASYLPEPDLVLDGAKELTEHVLR